MTFDPRAPVDTLVVSHGFEVGYTLGFVKGLVANGLRPWVISCDEDQAALSAAGVQNINLRGSVDPSRGRWRKASNLLSYHVRLAGWLLRHRVGTLHFTGILRNELILLEGLLLPWLFRWRSGRYLYTVHNILPHGKRRSVLFRWVYRAVYAAPDFLLVHAEPVRRELVCDFAIPPSRVVLTSIGLNEEMPVTPLTPEQARRDLGWDERLPVILLFGKMNPYKGVELLIRAFDRLPVEARLVLAGAFQDAAYRRTVGDAVASARRASDITLHDHAVPDDRVEAYFKAASVLVLPYVEISQSGVLFLAMRFGLPIVATDVGAFRSFVSASIGVVAQSNDDEGFSNALGEFFARRAQFDPAVIAAETRRYAWPAVCADLAHLYRPVSHSGRRRPR